MTTDLKAGTVALITGASSGIGAATARMLVEKGLKVICTGRNLGRLEKVVAELGGNGLAVELDVQDEKSIVAALSNLPEAWKQIDILINNAGHDVGGWQEFQDLDLAESAEVIGTNVMGLIRMTSHLVHGMIARNHGHIVNIGSTSSFTAYAKSTVYCASKFAVNGFTDSLRLDLANKAIRVTQIDPGVVLTGFQLSRYKGNQIAARDFVESYPTGLTPDDVGRSILFALEQPLGVMINRIVLEPTISSSVDGVDAHS